MTTDELQAALDKALQKHQHLEARQPEARASARVLSFLPRAAELYRNQVRRGLTGNPREALKARAVLKAAGTGGRGDRT